MKTLFTNFQNNLRYYSKSLSPVIRLINPIGFIIINFIIIGSMLFQNDQFNDIVLKQIHEKKDLFDVFIFLSVFLWALILFLTSHFALKYYEAENTDGNKDFNTKLLNYFPTIVGNLGILIFLIKFDSDLFFLIGFIITIIGFSWLTEYIKKKLLNPILYETSKQDFHTGQLLRNKIKSIKDAQNQEEKQEIIESKIMRWLIYLEIFLAVIILVLQMYYLEIFSPLVVLLLAGIFWAIPMMFLSIIGMRERIYIFVIFIFLIIIFSRWNNNHNIRTISLENEIDTRVKIDEYVKNWVGQLLIDSMKDTTTVSDSLTIPIYIVAGEGGGIRAASWTGNTLAKLNEIDKNFYRNTLGFSTVSGSSIGAGFFQAMKYNKVPNDSISSKMDKVVREDFLSPLTINLFFWDAFQRLLPIPFESFDRTRALEDGFEYYFKKHNKYTTLEHDFLLVCGTKNFDKPIFLMNTTEVEKGRKAIISNVKIDNKFFGDGLDVIDNFKVSFPFNSAFTASARFPFVTPAGRLRRNIGEKEVEGSLADGGYFENTGLSSALNLFFVLESVLKNDEVMKEVFESQSKISYQNKSVGFSKKKQVVVFKPKIIFLKNGLKSKDDVNNSLSWKYEYAPAVAFYNAWDRESYTTEFETQTIINLLNRRLENIKPDKKGENKKLKYDGFKILDKSGNEITTTYDSKMSLDLEFIKFDLPRKEGDLLPLGWMLSAFAADSIQIHLNRKTDFLKKNILEIK